LKPVLVLALGNQLAGDDALGCWLAEQAAADPELSARADVICAGTDIFRRAGDLAGRDRIIILDAAIGGAGAASVRVLPHPLPPASRRSNAHALDPVAALDLLRSLEPAIAAAEVWWLLVEVPGVTLGPQISADAAARLPEAMAVLRRLVLELTRPS
jgi:hydrogenase maturation protease